jgi:hypothetical protein
MMTVKTILRAALVALTTQHAAAGAATPLRKSVRKALPCFPDGNVIENLWLVDALTVAYTNDERVQPSIASWRVTNTISGTVEELSCNLRANYICELSGTASDPTLQVWLQVNLDQAWVTVNQSLPCQIHDHPR